MAFSFPELRVELDALGYGGVPDQFILSSMAQLSLGVSSSSNEGVKTRKAISKWGRRGKSSVKDDWPLLPREREFSAPKRKPMSLGEGLNAACFTSEFAEELNEMKKMLKVMEGTREELFGTLSKRNGAKGQMGLAEEHEHYIGSLMEQWRIVGRTLLTKRNTHSLTPENINEGPSEDLQSEEQRAQGLLPAAGDAESDRRMRSLNTGDDMAKVATVVPEMATLVGQRDDFDLRPNEYGTIAGSPSCSPAERGISPPPTMQTTEALPDNSTLIGRQGSPSAISPGASYQQGGMLYCEVFSDSYGDSVVLNSHQEDEPPSHLDNSAKSPLPPSSPGELCTPESARKFLTVRSDLPIVAPFDFHLDQDVTVNSQVTNEQNKLANLDLGVAADILSHKDAKFLSYASVETENPVVLGVPAFRTPDRRGGSAQSPLNDRSNIRTGGDAHVTQQSGSKAVLNKITEFKSPVSSKRSPAVTLKRSRSSRDAPDNERVDNKNRLSDLSGERLSSRLAAETTPPTGRRVKSEKAYLHPLSENSPKNVRRSAGASDVSHLDISSLSLSSPRNLREPASSLKLSNSKGRSTPGNNTPEHRPCTCSVCPLSSRKTGGDSTRSPFGKNLESVSRESESSPKEKFVSRKEVRASPKQKIPLHKASGPSGIFTPLIDQKKNNVNSKVLFKTSQLTTPMDFSSENSRSAERRAPSLRSSTGSSRSSGQQRAPSSQSSKSNASGSPFTKRSSFNTTYDSQSSISKATLTPGGPRRGGKVDRVARFAEMQNLWKNDKFLKTSTKRKPQSFHRIFARLHLSHEQYTAAYRERILEDMRPRSEPEPFVVPPLYHTPTRLQTSGAFY